MTLFFSSLYLKKKIWISYTNKWQFKKRSLENGSQGFCRISSAHAAASARSIQPLIMQLWKCITITHKIKRQANQIIMPSHTHTQGHRQWRAHVKKKLKKKPKPKNTLFPPSPARPHLYKCGKTKRSHESVTAFQRALVLIVSLKQLFSSHSVPTSHSQLLAACTHMYVHPHGHFICRGNVLSV